MKEFLKKLGMILGTVITTLLGVFLFSKKEPDKSKPEEIKEETKNEIEEKSPSDIVNESDKRDVIQSGIKQEQDDFRQRVRDRFNKELQS